MRAALLCAYSAEKLFIIEQCRAVCGPPGIAFSRVGSWRQTAFAALLSAKARRSGKRPRPLSHRCAMPVLPKGEPLAKPYTSRFNRKLFRHAKASLMREVASPSGLDGRSVYPNHSFSRTSCVSRSPFCHLPVTSAPLFVTCGDISPRRGENLSRQGEVFLKEGA